MLSIDEAIARERQLAKEQRSHVDTWDDEYSKKCKVYAEEHEQIAEWLEELKSSRQELNELRKYSYVQGLSDGYINAIDDFAEKMNAKCDGIIKDKWNSNVAPISWTEAYADFKDDIDEIAEQLKAGDK